MRFSSLLVQIQFQRRNPIFIRSEVENKTSIRLVSVLSDRRIQKSRLWVYRGLKPIRFNLRSHGGGGGGVRGWNANTPVPSGNSNSETAQDKWKLCVTLFLIFLSSYWWIAECRNLKYPNWKPGNSDSPIGHSFLREYITYGVAFLHWSSFSFTISKIINLSPK